MQLIAQLFGEAWEHRRRRHRMIAAGLFVAVFAVAIGVMLGPTGTSTPTTKVSFTSFSRYRLESTSRVLASAQVFLVGDLSGKVRQVHVTVVLKHPAAGVVAFVDGRPTDLRPFTSPSVRQPNTGFATVPSHGVTSAPKAFLAPPSVSLASPRPRNVAVRLLITYDDGRRVATELRAHLNDA